MQPVRRMSARGVGCLAVCAAIPALAAPTVRNPSFEADTFKQWPGAAGQNGGKITGWQFKGNVGLNPIVPGPNSKYGPHAFDDNGKVPHGKQVAFIQNIGWLAQRIAGFEVGKKYRVTYHENARDNNAPTRNPRMKVTLGGETIVSEHALKPVDPINVRQLPFNFVESAILTAPRSGVFELKFETTFGDRVAVLIDQVQIAEVTE